MGTAGKTKALLAAVGERVPMDALAGHFHDTYGQALTNVYAAMQMGVATFDSSVAGLGGCPYAKGATGNVASEDVLYLLDGLGIDTGIDMTALRAAGKFISDHLGRAPASRVARALAARDAAAGRRTMSDGPGAPARGTRCRRPASRCARSSRAPTSAPAASARSTKSPCGACSRRRTSARCSQRSPHAGRRTPRQLAREGKDADAER